MRVAGDMAPGIKCFLCKPQDLSKHLRATDGGVHVLLQGWGPRDRKIAVTSWADSLA